MSRLPARPLDQLDPPARQVWDQITSTRDESVVDERGGLRGPFNAWVTAPEVGKRLSDLGAYLRFGSPIERRLLELAIVTVGARWKAEFEWWAHSRMALEHGISSAVLDRIAAGERPVFERADEETVYDAAAQLCTDGRIEADTYAELRSLLGDEGVVVFVTLCGYYCLVSFTLNAFEVPLPPGASPAWG